MSNAVVGAVRVNLGLDSAQFQNGLRQATAGLQGIGKTMAGIAATVAAAGAGLSEIVRRMSATAAATGDVSDRLGVAVESLQELRHAAEMSGVGVNNFDVALRRFIRRASEAARGTGAAKDAFRELGVQLTDAGGNMRNTEAIFEDVADAMQKVDDPANKLRLAFKMFDTDGAAMVKMFENGSAGIRAFREQARELGIVLSEDAVRSSQRFQDSLNLIQKLAEGISNRIFVGVLPAFERMAATMLDVAKNSTVVEGVSNAISVAMNALTRAIGLALDNLHHLVDLLKVFVGLKLVSALAAVAGAFISVAKAVRSMGLIMAAVTALTRMKITTLVMLGAVAAKITGQFDNLTAWLKELGRTIHEALPESLRNSVDGVAESLRKLGADLLLTEAAAENSFATYLRVSEEAAASFGKVGEAGKSAGAQIAEGWRTTVDEIKSASSDAASAMANVGQMLQSSLTSNFQGIIDGSRSARDVVVDVLNDIARHLISSGISGLFNFGGAGGGGLGSLFSSLPGFANGGSFQVGGAGGIDSQLVAFRASPNERVSITKPGQERGGVSITQNFEFHNMDPSTRAWIRTEMDRVKRQAVSEAVVAVAKTRSLTPRYGQGVF